MALTEMSEQTEAPARGIERLGRVPLLVPWARRRYARYFDNATGLQLFRGKFDSFEAAEASAPKTKPVSYDNDASAELYLQRLRADAHDYPALFWLANSFADGVRTVFDVGGSVGIKYFAFSRLTPFPFDALWKVQDLPAVVERGRIGTAFCPYRVRAHGAFVKEVSECGFKLRDHWQNPAKFMHIPFEQGLDLDTYSGYCFDRA